MEKENKNGVSAKVHRAVSKSLDEGSVEIITKNGKQFLHIKQTGMEIEMNDLGHNGTMGFFRKSDWS